MAGVQLSRVWKRYGTVEAVRDLTLDCREGEFLAILGPSGCGKTSTLRMVAGLEEMSGGEIWIGGRRVNELLPKDRDIAMVFEDYALYPHMTVRENIAFPLRIRGISSERIAVRVREVAELLDLTDILDQGVRRLSGGQQQRVSIGRAIVRNPQVLLMDEPISHLDASMKVHLRGELKRLQKTLGMTTIYVTHDQLEAMALADRIAVMHDGVLQQVASPEEVYARPANEFVAGFIGEPPINFLDCEVRERDRVPKLFWNGVEIAPLPPKARGLPAGRTVRVGIRPTDLQLLPERGADTATSAEVLLVEPRGDVTVLALRACGTLLRAEVSAELRARPDETVWVQFPPDRLHIFDRETGQRGEVER
jgi:ABC-type sugar transport system ATPase subunit